ncbi:aminoglycoside phosphotransferase family protein [Aquamicrobium sp.]|uniref:aminoglycoside phosphotransferase family protein n=1 Tax=Aquamicrobium sp. TaxID=1872579 RepID=UPI00349E48FB
MAARSRSSRRARRRSARLTARPVSCAGPMATGRCACSGGRETSCCSNGRETLASLSHLERHGDDSATGIAAEVLQRLHAARDSPPPAALTPLHDILAALFLKAEGDRRAGRRTQFIEAAECAQALLSSQRDVRPLHGDVHHANILSAPRGWLAIDPKGLIGEPAFDAANLFCNPLEKDLRFREDRALSMAAILSPALGCAAERLLDYAFAFSALSAAWHLEDGDPGEAERSLAVGRAVRAARARLMS